MPASKKEYDDAFERVMHYVELELSSEGTKVHVENKQDLRHLLERLSRRPDGKRLTKPSIQRLLSTDAADKYVGRDVGRFGKSRTLAKPTAKAESRAQYLKRQGKSVYRYERSYAISRPVRTKNGVVKEFRDVVTGQRVDPSKVSYDEET